MRKKCRKIWPLRPYTSYVILIGFLVILIILETIHLPFVADLILNMTPLDFHYENKEICLSETDDEFLKILHRWNITVFITDPTILHPLLSPERQELLQKRNISFSLSISNVTSMGIFGNDSQHMLHQQDLLDDLKKIFSYSFSECSKNNITHRFFSKGEHLIHLTTFFEKDNYFWHAEVNTTLSILGRDMMNQVIFGRESRGLYDRFRIVQAHIENTSIQVPDDVAYFLFQIPTSTEISCNHQVYENFKSEYPFLNLSNPKLERNARLALKALKSLFRKPLIPFWISSGTLLGWYRQCGIIPYTSDIDLATWASVIDNHTAEIFKYRYSSVLKLAVIYGLPEYGYQFVLQTIDEINVDLFFMYEAKDYMYYCGHMPSAGAYFQYKYSKIKKLCSGVLLGEKILVPCNAAELVIEEYGPGWKKVVKDWNYRSSAFNRGPLMFWKDEDRKKASVRYV